MNQKWIGIPYLKNEIKKLQNPYGSTDYDAAISDVLDMIKKYEQKVEA
jgi:hypothetical protein